MAKLLTYIFLVVGLMILFNVAGLTTSTGIILQQLGIINPESVSNIQSTSFYIVIAVVALAALIGVGAAVSIGVFKTTVNETAITAVAGLTLALFIGDLISIVTYAGGTENWVKYLIFLIMTPIIFGYVISLYDWVRGKD